MQALVNKIWYQGHPLRWLLLPLSWIFAGITCVRRTLFRLGITSQTVMPIPVIIVGNITVGGSGKTPTVIYLIELLRQHGFKPGVISRGYGVDIQGVKTVNLDASAAEVGDEPAMIVARTQVPMVVGAKRVDAATALIAEFGVDVIICDDGLQHYALARDIELVVIDGQRGLGNGLLLPAGPLREGAWRLESVDFVLSNGGPAAKGQFEMQLAPTAVKPVKYDSTASKYTFDKSQPLVAMAGIGNPARFFESLRDQGYQLALCHGFDDHQAYDKTQLRDLAKGLPLLMTEKDAVKCRDFAQENWWYLAVDAKLPSQFDQQLLARLREVAATKQGNFHGIR
ncbi:tetraacyldisaccharide 4'-kinase [Shewanella glacialipiscicola]|uniref:Tetraacyldisaccharide 4'-kinase n=1 Tax=Shewanella glacialipiscicola TaxID=614069 RepID=A0ABQ6J3R4_9GAMM|nr:tetraacyldisaccharide 4'-kinase [Shewanella glacialipiscicola]MCL1085367.1 tetraacyldisaccharide 4'-kinase [Shewanella glacialipiscicola]MCU7996150.1 tetraacyldisaccharide 4'-kinase [Shewanella glacialipiscicola]MCU8027403.1 tetraacyldisaccharide 4'-kinase [Shewanella glacialipiscicola]GIU13857.1 tetraacyldisaccharide 4'-kinase [Shewanella glacialipiscicola]GMA81587.1 tetraacyldisaccharide 4'-kinase [Shewanella glacialipiscicola]